MLTFVLLCVFLFIDLFQFRKKQLKLLRMAAQWTCMSSYVSVY